MTRNSWSSSESDGETVGSRDDHAHPHNTRNRKTASTSGGPEDRRSARPARGKAKTVTQPDQDDNWPDEPTLTEGTSPAEGTTNNRTRRSRRKENDDITPTRGHLTHTDESSPAEGTRLTHTDESFPAEGTRTTHTDESSPAEGTRQAASGSTKRRGNSAVRVATTTLTEGSTPAEGSSRARTSTNTSRGRRADRDHTATLTEGSTPAEGSHSARNSSGTRANRGISTRQRNTNSKRAAPAPTTGEFDRESDANHQHKHRRGPHPSDEPHTGHSSDDEPLSADNDNSDSDGDAGSASNDSNASSERHQRTATTRSNRAPRSTSPPQHRRPLGQQQRSQQAASTTTTTPGTLAYLSEQIKGDKAIDDITAAAYINKWNSSILAGTATFEHDLNRARRRNPQPTVFAIMDVASNFIQLAHGIEEVVLDDADDHDADGQIGFFLGDRVNVKVAGMIQQHDPTFVLIPTLDDLTAQFHGRPAKSNECAKTNHKGLLPVDPKARMVDVPKIHPIPPLWWGWFLQRDRTPTQTYQWAAAVTRRWKTGTEKIAADSLKRWLRAACTESLEVARSSAIHVNLLPSGRDNLVLEWASNSLHQYLPRPKQTPPTPSPTQQRDTTRTPSRYTDADTVRDAMRLAHAVVQSSADRPSREPTKDKTMPETTLCRLLGLSSLTWADREHLAPIWQKLHQQPDRHAKGMVLRAFFQQLGKQDPAFRRF